ncbi:glycerol dehydrogenase [Halobellus sp. MBLA0160]|uniref:Glycerol dehydrogenase n=1 Tax=Halobellus ruber TaxID=2761102 RepID=A0A7J9SJS9_9EURY|nr:glycerol dehydrogenase [Halobellus ruber]
MTRIFRSPSAYVQGRHVIDNIGEHAQTDGSRAVIIADPAVRGIVGDSIRSGLEATGLTTDFVDFGGTCTDSGIDRAAEEAEGADLVVGAGGGRTLDTAKAVAARHDTRMVTVPTIASTDAPTSSLSVVYTEEGEFEELRFHGVHPDLVLVDTAVIAAAPIRFFRSGIADAIATRFEAETAIEAGAENVFGGQSTRAARAIARECFRTVEAHGESALAAVERDAVTKNVESVVEAATLLSGIGFESGGLAAAHAVHDGLTRIEPTHDATHGEKVNIGTLTQLVLEGRDIEEFHDIVDLSLDLNLSVTLAQIGLTDPSDEQLRTIAEAACQPQETIHNEPFDVSPEAVREALVTADELARQRRNTREPG